MDYDFGEAGDQLRSELRELIADRIPSGYLGAFTDDPDDLAVAQRFCKELAARGLLTISWPEEFGGRGASLWLQTVVREEMWAHHEPRGAQYMGLNWVGPAIMEFGTSEQKMLHLPAMASGDEIWCQGFSEPDAGSDLSALSMRADPSHDGWRISGQKIWTSYAEMAHFCFLAARVAGNGDKHDGITIFLIPMDREGIDVRPIKSMLGPHHLNECFFDNVWASPSEILGDVGQGWSIIRRTLAYERVGIARYARCDRLLSLVGQELDGKWGSLPPALRARWNRALIKVRVARLLAYRCIAAQSRGEPTDALASVARVAVTQCDQEVAETLFQVLGHRSLESADSSASGDTPEGGAPLHGAVEDHWRYAQAATVASGTIEIQRTLIARSILASYGSGAS
ncbi:MAG TPA: acyl-CoA dehydrogenase family protein [Acidimicrobiales bacterium]|nr:acyl-CoA dehydrogenase family protein [Acidimicrobiales bacterium]